MRRQRGWVWPVAAAVALGILCLLLTAVWTARLDRVSLKAHAASAAPVTQSATGRDHLLLYAFSYTDPEFLHNLEYFVKEAVLGDTVADYVIIVQEGPGLQVIVNVADSLPRDSCWQCHATLVCVRPVVVLRA